MRGRNIFNFPASYIQGINVRQSREILKTLSHNLKKFQKCSGAFSSFPVHTRRNSSVSLLVMAVNHGLEKVYDLEIWADRLINMELPEKVVRRHTSMKTTHRRKLF